tara:strand:- start:3318 stop:4253 length:936 start_codon:yes stop_codon:yes gene_type:complete
MKAIMYHYVQEFNKDLPNLKFLNFDDFKKQLDFFEKEFKILSKSEFYYNFKNNKCEKNGIILTFDDGLNCHYEYVYKELIKRKLFGIFYINSESILRKKILRVHKIHILLSKIDDKKLLNFILFFFEKNNLEIDEHSVFSKKTYINQNNKFEFKYVKQLLNYLLVSNKSDILLNEIEKEFKINLELYKNSYYLNISKLNEMKNNGMILGNHTSNHESLSRLTEFKQKVIITECDNKMIENSFHDKMKTFCYPYGGRHNYDKNTLSILSKLNYNYAFSVEPRDILIDDLINNRLELPRYDCNMFKYGKPFMI